MVKQFFTTQCWLPVQEYTTQPPSNRLTDSQFSIFIVHNQYSQLRQRKDFIVNSLLLICMHLYIHFPCYCEPMTCLTLSRYKLPAACTVTLSLMCFISPFCLFFFLVLEISKNWKMHVDMFVPSCIIHCMPQFGSYIIVYWQSFWHRLSNLTEREASNKTALKWHTKLNLWIHHQ